MFILNIEEISRMYKFGSKILLIIAIVFIILGIYSVLFNNTPLFFVINRIMDPHFGGNEMLSNDALYFKTFSWDFLGMFHVIWGVNLFSIVKHGLMKKEPWAWRCIVVSVIVWLFVDVYFTLSIKRNTFFFVTVFFAVLFIIPLIMTKSVLKEKGFGQYY
jgi:hypothetical protein